MNRNESAGANGATSNQNLRSLDNFNIKFTVLNKQSRLATDGPSVLAPARRLALLLDR